MPATICSVVIERYGSSRLIAAGTRAKHQVDGGGVRGYCNDGHQRWLRQLYEIEAWPSMMATKTTGQACGHQRWLRKRHDDLVISRDERQAIRDGYETELRISNGPEFFVTISPRTQLNMRTRFGLRPSWTVWYFLPSSYQRPGTFLWLSQRPTYRHG